VTVKYYVDVASLTRHANGYYEGQVLRADSLGMTTVDPLVWIKTPNDENITNLNDFYLAIRYPSWNGRRVYITQEICCDGTDDDYDDSVAFDCGSLIAVIPAVINLELDTATFNPRPILYSARSFSETDIPLYLDPASDNPMDDIGDSVAWYADHYLTDDASDEWEFGLLIQCISDGLGGETHTTRLVYRNVTQASAQFTIETTGTHEPLYLTPHPLEPGYTVDNFWVTE
jgi:hypothetical protein